MAIITNLSKCPICNNSLGDDMEAIISFPADAISPLSSFYQFYDGAAHKQCLNSWSRKEEFVKEWNSSVLSNEPVNESLLLSITEVGDVFFNKKQHY